MLFLPGPALRHAGKLVWGCDLGMARPGTFRAHGVVICRETIRTTESAITGYRWFAAYLRRPDEHRI